MIIISLMQKWQTEKHRLGHGIQIPLFQVLLKLS